MDDKKDNNQDSEFPSFYQEPPIDPSYAPPPMMPMPYPPPKSKKNLFLWLFGCSSGCLLSVLILIMCFFFTISLFSGLGETPNEEIIDFQHNFSKIAIHGASETSNMFVAHIKLDGPIMLNSDEDDFFSTNFSTANNALKQIQKATNDPKCDGIILDLTTPGGGVTDSDIIWKALMDFRATTGSSGIKRTVTVLMGDTVASGGYYISTAADYIFAHPTTMTGSIGVIISSINATELAQKLGIAPVTIKSGKTKDFLNPLRPLTAEEEAMLQAMVDELNNRFIDLIVKGRKLNEEDVRAIADGRVMLANEALEHGLIDEIGYFSDVVQWITDENSKEVCVYQYVNDSSFFSILHSPGFVGKCASEAINECIESYSSEGEMLVPAYR